MPKRNKDQPTVLLIDNYDSFVHNLARYLVRLGVDTIVARNDQISLEDVQQMAPQAIVISPGPCGPRESGIGIDVVQKFYRRIPFLGVCLGHQIIAESFGAQIIRAPHPVHGRASTIHHQRRGLFQNVESPVKVGRYHSLIVDETSLPQQLVVTSRTDDGILMSLEHTDFPVFGVQFHPESILTDCGFTILRNFLRFAGIDPAANRTTAELPTFETERIQTCPAQDVWPSRPVTF